MKYIDIHAHVNFAAFRDDYADVLKRAHDAEVTVINVGTKIGTSKRAVELADEFPDVYAIVGLHPIHTEASQHDEEEIGGRGFVSRGELFDSLEYKKLASNKKVVAIGECGLDYYRLNSETKDIQKEIFIKHIRLANDVEKPLMLHIRDARLNDSVSNQAYEDAYEILKREARVPMNVHFFAGNVAVSRKFLDLGATLSFTGAITYGKNYEEVLQFAPLDRLLSETDCPFVAPHPHRGERNEPMFIPHVVEKIGVVKSESAETVRTAIMENARRLFFSTSLSTL